MNLEYKAMLNHKTQIIRNAKRKYNDKINKILQQSSFNDKLSWRLIKKHKQSSPNDIPTLLYNNKTITNPTEKTEILHKVLCHPKNPNLQPKHIKFHKHIDNKINDFCPSITQKYNPLDILNSPIQRCEIENCIWDLDINKAHGPDLIHNQMIKKGGPTLITHLLTLFNKCLANGTFPNIWNYANICTIPKPGKFTLTLKTSVPLPSAHV